MSKILRSTLRAPGIVEEILDGHADYPLMLEQVERPLPASWAEQRARILEPKTSSAVWPSGVAIPLQSPLLRS